jgi:hypothetical protein
MVDVVHDYYSMRVAAQNVVMSTCALRAKDGLQPLMGLISQVPLCLFLSLSFLLCSLGLLY